MKMNFNDFAGGGLAEQLNAELGKVLENIQDPNTEPKKSRKLTMTLSFKPEENREVASVDIKIQTALQPQKPLNTTILIDRDLKTGKVVGNEYRKQVPGQVALDIHKEEIANGMTKEGLQIVK